MVAQDSVNSEKELFCRETSQTGEFMLEEVSCGFFIFHLPCGSRRAWCESSEPESSLPSGLALQ